MVALLCRALSLVAMLRSLSSSALVLFGTLSRDVFRNLPMLAIFLSHVIRTLVGFFAPRWILHGQQLMLAPKKLPQEVRQNFHLRY